MNVLQRRRGLRAQGLAAVNELGGAPHGGAGGAAGQEAGRGLARQPGRPDPAALGQDLLPRPGGALGGQHPEHAVSELEDRGGDAPAPAHEGPKERELRERVGGSEAPPGRQFLCGLSFPLRVVNLCGFSQDRLETGRALHNSACRGTLGCFFTFNAPVVIRQFRQLRAVPGRGSARKWAVPGRGSAGKCALPGRGSQLWSCV